MDPLASPIEAQPHSQTSRLAKNGLLLYFVVAFAFTWVILGLAILAARGVISLSVSATVLVTLATLGPFLAALSATGYESGRTGVRALLQQVARWRVHPIWYVVVLVAPGLIMGTAFLLWRALGGPTLPAPPLSIWLSLPVLIVVLLIPALFEEVGWRGFALPRLQLRYNALVASLILGVIHASWHIPLWFIPGLGFDSLPFPFYALLVIGLAVIFAWLYNSTSGSLLVIGLFHAAINAYPAPWGTALQTLPAETQGLNIQIPVAITVAVFALLVVWLTDWRTLTRKR